MRLERTPLLEQLQLNNDDFQNKQSTVNKALYKARNKNSDYISSAFLHNLVICVYSREKEECVAPNKCTVEGCPVN